VLFLEDDKNNKLEQYFFEFEMEMEGNICRKAVSTEEEHEKSRLLIAESILLLIYI